MMKLAAAVLGVLLVLPVVLTGCTSRTPAPVDDRRPPPGAPAKPPAAQGAAPGARAEVTYFVKRGDTLYSIALEHGVDFRELARWNKLEDATRLRVGQELRVSSPGEPAAAQVGVARASRDIESRPLAPGAGAGPAGAGAGPVVAGEGGTKTGPKALRMTYSEANLAMLSRGEFKPEARPDARPETRPEPAKPVAAVPVAAPERAADAIDFIWPAKGRVLAGFAEPRSKGIDIEGRPGDPVVAAASGRVIYVGSGIPGLGKFIVVRHDNGYNTVYAHNRENLVKMDQNLSRGQKIAELGSTDTDTPKLHFQIRKLGTPLDPQKYLPPS
jgi:lipoprotein NlpD